MSGYIVEFIYRLIKNICLFLCISLPLTLLGIVVLSIVCIKYKIGQLPAIFRWFDSADPYIGRDTTVIDAINQQGYWVIYCWLAFRNPINYFTYKYLSFTFKNPIITTYIGDARVGDSTGDRPGLKYIEIKQDNKVYYEYYYIHKWNATHCLRFRMGWKIGDVFKDKNGQIQQQVLVLQPYKSYSGI